MLDPVVSLLKYWVGNGANTTWTTVANWQDNSVPVNDTTTNTAVFNSASAYTRQPAGASQSIKGLNFTGAADVTFAAGTLTVGTGGITVGSGAGAVSPVDR